MANLLTGKIALVTGAGSGIGQAIAVAYAQEGAKVVITDLNLVGCHQTLEKIQDLGGQGWVYALDVTDVAAVQTLANQVQNELGNIDILVNNAGVILREGIDSPNAHAVIRKVMDVNLLGVFNTIHAWLPALRATRGCIVNISSGAAFLGQPRALGYSGLTLYESLVNGMPEYQSLVGVLNEFKSVPRIESGKVYQWILSANA
jgi:NAD(P)-dependent dehydrogenase (short-subunit alcohol dehydrogenase family)